MRNKKFQKNSKIFQKIKNIQFGRHSKPKLVGKGSKRENKNYRSVSFLPDAEEKIKKNSKKLNKLKDTVMASFQAKIGWKRPR